MTEWTISSVKSFFYKVSLRREGGRDYLNGLFEANLFVVTFFTFIGSKRWQGWFLAEKRQRSPFAITHNVVFQLCIKICLELCTMQVLAHLVPGKTLSHPSTRRASQVMISVLVPILISQANLLQATDANVAMFLHAVLHYFTLALVLSQVECFKSFKVFKF